MTYTLSYVWSLFRMRPTIRSKVNIMIECFAGCLIAIPKAVYCVPFKPVALKNHI